MLHVAILTDALDMQYKAPAGTFNYARKLVEGIASKGIAVTSIHYRLDIRQSTREITIPLVGPANRNPSPVQLIPRNLIALRTLHRLNPHVVHMPVWGMSYTPMLMLKCVNNAKIVATVHDLAPIIYPRFYKYRYLERVGLSQSLILLGKVADAIIAISQNTARDLMSVVNIPKDKIRVIYQGVGGAFKPMDKDMCRKAIAEIYGVKRKYVLYVGTMHPRKNLKTLVLSYALSRKQGLEHELVLAGRGGDEEPEIRRLASESNINSHVQTVRDVPYKHLPYLYNAADVFIYLSLYEGFGLPVLEAMACGTPVIASNASSLPEVVGDAGILVNPRDIEETSQALVDLLENGELRSELSAKGIQRAGCFRWADTIQKTLDVYRCLT